MEEGVSVIICCYNSSKRIVDVLKHLSNQKLTQEVKWEIILVDNASDDDTVELAQKSWNLANIPLHVVTEPQKGLSNARKTGIRESHYNLISFIDDDNWINPRWIESAYKVMQENTKVALVGGRGIAVFEKSEPYWFNRFQRSFAVGKQAQEDGILKKPDGYLYGAGIVLRKHVWNELIAKGFDFQLSGRKGKVIASGEDSEMCYAIRLAGYELYYSSSLTFEHIMSSNRLTIDYLKQLTRSFGRSSVIIDMYINLLLNSKGLAKLKIQYYFFALLHSCYNILLMLSRFLRNKIARKASLESEINLIYSLENLKQKLRLFGRYGHYVRTIWNAQWHDYGKGIRPF